MSEYNAQSIQHLSFREGCRLRVGVYLGSADNEGVLNGLLEIVNNSTDEANAGFGDTIEIGINDTSARVRDYGRGLPRGKTDKTEEIMITLLTENHSGAKFDKKAYSGFSRGLNGSGGGATCVSSDWMEVISWRDGYEWKMRFEKGIPTTKTAVQGEPEKRTGTLIEWSPSQDVFSTEPIHFDYEQVCNIIEEYSYFNVGIKFIVTNYQTKEVRTFLSKNGLIDFADNKIKNGLHKIPITHAVKENGIEIEIIAKWTSGKEKSYLFVNGAECTEGGTPITGAKTGITRTMNNLTNRSFEGELLRRGLVYIIAIKHPQPIFANQIKTKISNAELRGMCDTAFRLALTNFKAQCPQDFEQITGALLKTEKAELAAERARIAVMQSNKDIEKTQKMKVFSSDKLKDASKLGKDSILLLVEGNSAAASMLNARDYTKYGVLALRGKVINALSNDDEKIYNNEEVKLILSAMGISPTNYSPSKLRYGKAAICVDGDNDGYHISLLLMSLFSKIAPQFLKEERLVWLRAPLYKVSHGKKDDFFYSDDELKLSGIKGEQTRYKGLGEMSVEDTKASMFCPDNQRLEGIDYSGDGINRLVELMGKDVAFRKDFVMNRINFSELER